MARKLPDEYLYDKRLIERHLRQGLISTDELKKRLDKAEDLADQAEHLDFTIGRGTDASAGQGDVG